VRGEVDDRLHHRAEARDGAAAEVVAVGKAARQDDAVAVTESRSLCQRYSSSAPSTCSTDPAAVPVGPRPGEDPRFRTSSARGRLRSVLGEWLEAAFSTWKANVLDDVVGEQLAAHLGDTAASLILVPPPPAEPRCTCRPGRRRPRGSRAGAAALDGDPLGVVDDRLGVTITLAVSLAIGCAAPP